MRCVAVAAFVGALLVSGSAWAGPPWATDAGSLERSHLVAGDLPSAPDRIEANKGACGEPEAVANGCLSFTKNLWVSKDAKAVVWTTFDLRWVFPDAAAAERFIKSVDLSEGYPAVAQPPAVGADAKMFSAQGDFYGLGVDMFMYNLVFRVDNVVVKVFVTQGPEVQGKPLTPLMVGAIGQKAVGRIRSAEPGAAPVAVTPAPTPTPEPIPTVTPEPTPQAVPEPPPEPPRSRSRLGDDVRDYWKSGSLRKPYVFVGGAYSRAIGSFVLPGGTPLDDKNAFDIAVGALMHPRIYFQLMFHREAWQVPKQQEVLVRRLELIFGVDLLALPPKWRVRPALLALFGFGLGFGRSESLLGSSDPAPSRPIDERKGIGIGGVFGGEFAVHLRVTKKFEIAPFAGILAPAYTYTQDFPAADRRIEGERGFGRAWRWSVGLKIGFGGPD